VKTFDLFFVLDSFLCTSGKKWLFAGKNKIKNFCEGFVFVSGKN